MLSYKWLWRAQRAVIREWPVAVVTCFISFRHGKAVRGTNAILYGFFLIVKKSLFIRHERLKAVMSDRPDLIQSELAGLAFDALQQCFRASDIDALMTSEPPPFTWAQKIYIVIDPAAGGPQSDFAFVSFYRQKGLFVV